MSTLYVVHSAMLSLPLSGSAKYCPHPIPRVVAVVDIMIFRKENTESVSELTAERNIPNSLSIHGAVKENCEESEGLLLHENVLLFMSSWVVNKLEYLVDFYWERIRS